MDLWVALTLGTRMVGQIDELTEELVALIATVLLVGFMVAIGFIIIMIAILELKE